MYGGGWSQQKQFEMFESEVGNQFIKERQSKAVMRFSFRWKETLNNQIVLLHPVSMVTNNIQVKLREIIR